MKNKKVLGGLFVLLTSAFCLPNLTSCSNQLNSSIGNDVNELDDLTGYVANIENASSIGIGSINTSNTNVKKQKNVIRKENNQNNEYLLTATENENGEINYEELIFTKFESGFEEINGEENYIAKREEDINTKINSIQHGVVNIKSKSGFEYRLLDKNGNSLTDWKAGENGNTKFYDITEDKENIKIESRSEKGKISFFVNEGFKYTISLNDKIIIENMEDNDNNDVNKKQGVITLDNLEGDKTYLVKYHGKGKKKTLTQDQMNYRISRVYVSGGFTFVTFMPKNNSELEEQLNKIDERFIGRNCYNIGGEGKYEKETKSYVIDNESGHIYSLDDISVLYTRDGMVLVADEDNTKGLLYELSVNENNELVFTCLIKNAKLQIDNFFKDRYGIKYVKANASTELYDEDNNMHIYCSSNGENIYFKNSNNETVKAKRNQFGSYYCSNIIESDGQERNLNKNDSFYIVGMEGEKIMQVENGWIKDKGFSEDIFQRTRTFGAPTYYKIDVSKEYNTGNLNIESCYSGYLESCFIDLNPIEDNNCIFWNSNDYYCLDNIWDSMRGLTDIQEYKIISNCRETLDEYGNFRLAQAGINGDRYFKIVKTKEYGKVKFEAVEASSYVGTSKEIILQPLN